MIKILYIEDTENNRILITRRLGQSNYKVLTAETAEQGMAVARAEKPDLILMDMGLPEGAGSWLRRLRNQAISFPAPPEKNRGRPRGPARRGDGGAGAARMNDNDAW